MYAKPQTDAEVTQEVMDDEWDQVIRGVNSMANEKRFDEVQRKWPESLNIEDRRNEHVDAILDEMKRKKF